MRACAQRRIEAINGKYREFNISRLLFAHEYNTVFFTKLRSGKITFEAN